MTGDDRDLRERFQALRREDDMRAPSMARLVRDAAKRGKPGWAGRLIVAGACLAIMVAAAVWLLPIARRPHGIPHEGPATVSITAWRAPTDFLLDTPGSDFLRTVPAIGVPPDARKSPPESARRRR